jgi:hypothetical protein
MVIEAFAIPVARDAVNAAVDALVNESIDGLSTHALGEDLISIRWAVDRLEAEFLRRLDRFDRGHGALADGGGSTASWLRDHCAMAWKAGAYRVRLARTLGEVPASLDSARAGRASLGNVTLIAQLANAVGVEQVAPLEHILVGAAETLDLTDMGVAPPADGSAWTGRTRALPLSVGRATRTIPPHIRTALNLREQGCRFPGCDRPAAWTDGHHIIHLEPLRRVRRRTPSPSLIRIP